MALFLLSTIRCDATTLEGCLETLALSHEVIALAMAGQQAIGSTINSEHPYIYESTNHVELTAYPAESEDSFPPGTGFSATEPTILMQYPSIVVQKFYYEDIGIYYNNHLTNSFEVYCHFHQLFIDPCYEFFIFQ